MAGYLQCNLKQSAIFYDQLVAGYGTDECVPILPK